MRNTEEIIEKVKAVCAELELLKADIYLLGAKINRIEQCKNCSINGEEIGILKEDVDQLQNDLKKVSGVIGG